MAPLLVNALGRSLLMSIARQLKLLAQQHRIAVVVQYSLLTTSLPPLIRPSLDYKLPRLRQEASSR